jgi:hypothetical protein
MKMLYSVFGLKALRLLALVETALPKAYGLLIPQRASVHESQSLVQMKQQQLRFDNF